jgi:UDP-2-acetamido-2-deoxy-ribo-hexuluronate aminotransferase
MVASAVPFIDLGRSRSLVAGVEKDWEDVLARAEFVGGRRVAELERLVARQLGVPHVVSCANGTDALIVGLQAMGVRPGDAVALPNLTFWATYEAVVQVGARPVILDVDPTDLQMSFDRFRQAHERHRFRAAVLVHLFGWASGRVREFRRFCGEREIGLLEDGAQCYGAELDGTPILAGARMATLSFYPAKVIGGALDGGAVACASESEAALVRALCNHGRAAHYSYAHVGWNSRMGGLQAAYLLRMCGGLDRVLADRRASLAHYEELLGDVDAGGHVTLHRPPSGQTGNGYLLVATLPGLDAAAAAKALEAQGIGSARTYPETIAQQPPARGAEVFGPLDVSTAFCRSVLNLPLFYGITSAERTAAANALRAVVTPS